MNTSLEDVLKSISDKYGGIVCFDEALRRHSTISIGGNALAWYEPSSIEELVEVSYVSRNSGIEIVVVGNGSNMLMPDGKSDKVYVSLSHEEFCGKIFDPGEVSVGSGEKLSSLISECCRKGYSAMEGLVGIPGTIGGALIKNAGYKKNIGSCLKRVKVVDSSGNIKVIDREEMTFMYRDSTFDKNDIILEATFNVKTAEPSVLMDEMKTYFIEKMTKQPLEEKTLGCMFKNPGDSEYSAGELIDKARLKGSFCGGAYVSGKHANFIVNSGGATQRDVLELIGKIKNKVKEQFDIELELEIDVVE